MPTGPAGVDWQRLAAARIIDLAHGMQRGMPVSVNHPAYQMALLRRHGDMVRADGTSAANEVIVTGGHVGTHVDALCHVSYRGKLHGNVDAAAVTDHYGFSRYGVDTITPFVCRGVLLDVAGVRGDDPLPPGYEVTARDLGDAEDRAGVEVAPGDAVLIRTGWSRHWGDPATFGGQVHGAPGPGADAARWLVDRRVRVAGAETLAFEVIRPGSGHAELPVHRLLLVDAGIHIIEAMNLTGLGAGPAPEFLFVAVPLKLVGATGSPVRPLAIVDG